MSDSVLPGMFDRVLVRDTPETAEIGIAGMEGDVYGFTTPSVTGVEVIGGAPEDFALNVSFKDSKGEFWLRPDLVQLLNHNEGTELRVGGAAFVRESDGSWLQTEGSSGSRPSFWRRLVDVFRRS